jgi:hypothetical protein
MRSTQASAARVCITDLLKDLLAAEGKCLLVDECLEEYISEAQAEYWRRRGDVEAYSRIVMGYEFLPATRPIGLHLLLS